jgi:protease PrsW
MRILKNKLLLGMVVLIVLGIISSSLLSGVVLEFQRGVHLLFSWVVSLLPALLWLWLFYRTDKYDKEPGQLIIGMFVLGALVAYGLSVPLEELVRQRLAPDKAFTLGSILPALLIIGLLQETLKFVVVRLSVYNSPHFNEPADGMVYMISAGIGAAFAYNIVYFNALGTINTGIVITRIIEFYLTSAAFAGIAGYFMGVAKFRKQYLGGELIMFAGVLLAAVANAAYVFIKDYSQGMNFNIWTELLVTVVFSALILVIMLSLLSKTVESSPFKPSNQ